MIAKWIKKQNKYKNKIQYNFKIEEMILVLTITMEVERDKGQDKALNNMIEIEVYNRFNKTKHSWLVLVECLCSAVQTVNSSLLIVNSKFHD